MKLESVAGVILREIVIELFQNWAPVTVSNFVKLVNDSFYDGIFFHRVIDDFVIQTGDPTCTALELIRKRSLMWK